MDPPQHAQQQQNTAPSPPSLQGGLPNREQQQPRQLLQTCTTTKHEHEQKNDHDDDHSERCCDNNLYKINYERYMKRWIESGDRAAMLQLLRNHRVASYLCKGGFHASTSTNCLEPYALWHGDLVGTYDIVFMAVDPPTTAYGGCGDGSDTDTLNFPSISRAVTTGTLTLVSKQSAPTPAAGQQRGCVVYGTIQHVTATNSGRRQGESDLQEMTIEFCQVPITLQGDTKFRVTKVNGQDIVPSAIGCNHNHNSNYHNHHHTYHQNNTVTSYGILTQPGVFGWSPIEDQPQTQEDMKYIEFMQQELAQRYSGHYNWREEHSWLCRYMGIPVEAARAIHAFNYHPLPPPCWSWKAGDLLLSIRLDNGQQHKKYSSSGGSSSVYLARPRDPNRLLKKIRDRYPIFDAGTLPPEASTYHHHHHHHHHMDSSDEDTDDDYDDDDGIDNDTIIGDDTDTDTDDEDSDDEAATNDDDHHGCYCSEAPNDEGEESVSNKRPRHY